MGPKAWREARLRRVVAAIQEDIARLQPGERLPSQRYYRQRLGVQGEDVAAALRRLEAEGVLHIRGVTGAFAGPKQPALLDGLRGRQKPPGELLGKPVVAWCRMPVREQQSGSMFLVLCKDGHLYDIHSLRIYRHGTVGTPGWVTRGQSWCGVKEAFEKKADAAGVALPRDFFKDKEQP